MQASIMSFCLKNACAADASMHDVLKLAAEEGIGNVEVYAGGWDFDGDVRQAAEALRKVADDVGVSLPTMGSGTRLGHLSAERETCMATLRAEAEACAVLGGSVMTLPIVDGQPIAPDQPNATVGVRFERMLPELVAQLQELADHASNFGVELAVLNHCFLVYLSWHQKWLAILCERANVGACVDPGNYLHYGHQEPVGACEELAPYAKMARAGGIVRVSEDDVIAGFADSGNFRPWAATLFDEGDIDQAACYDALARGGFDGYVSLKTAGNSPDGPLVAIRHSWKKLEEAIAD